MLLNYSGDLVQLSDTTVFRFNHLQEASRMRKSQHEVCVYSAVYLSYILCSSNILIQYNPCLLDANGYFFPV